ncbi:ATP-binding protein [Methylobacterium terricola]|nr:ATP-binding protein [Methylobacterium terricola]
MPINYPIFWNFDVATREISWASTESRMTSPAPTDILRPSLSEPFVEIEAGLVVPLSDLATQASQQGAFVSGRIASWTDGSEWMDCEIYGYAIDGEHVSGAIFRHPQARRERSADLTQVLIEGIEALPEAFVLYDQEDRLVICNEQYRRLYPGVADMMRPGTYFPELVRESLARGVFQIEERQQVWEERRLSFHRTGIGFFEQHLADGRWIQVSERRTASGGTTSIRADITVLKERERELRAARAAAEAETASRTAFIAKVGHELRNPLNVVFGIAQLLAGQALPKPHAAMIGSLVGAARVMRDVLDDILDIATVEAGAVTIRRETTACRPFLQEMVEIARTTVAQSGLTLRARIAGNLPDDFVTDPRRLRQILLNLLSNAVKYTERGSIAISASVRATSQADAVLRIAVTDSGSGIPAEIRDRLFAPYARQREHVASGIEGFGLGLSISAELARAIGARLGVEPGPRGGTRAWVEVPLRHDQGAPHPRGTDRMTAAKAPVLDVLVVDDEPTNLLVAEALLRRLGHRVTTALGGAACLRALSEKRFDVALLDIAMGEMSGLDVARWIAARDGTGIALVAMTGNVMPADVKSYLAAGFAGFVEKPVDLKELSEVLATLMVDRGGGRILRPEERVRFPRAEAVSAFDRTSLDRMVADIGHASVAAIVAAGIATFRQTADALASGADGDLAGLFHKVRAIAGLFGLDDLAAGTAQRDEAGSLPPTPRQRKALRGSLSRAIAQMERYALDLEVTTRPPG